MATSYSWRSILPKKTKPQYVWYDVAAMQQLLSNLGFEDRELNYLEISMLYTLFSKRSEAFTHARWSYIDDKGEDRPDDPILKLINQPNKIQTSKEFLTQYGFFLSRYGANYIEKLAPVGMDDNIEKVQLFNLDPQYLEVPEYSYKHFTAEDYNPDFKYNDGNGKIFTIPFDKVIITWDDTPRTDNFLKGTSKTEAGKQIFINSQLRLEADGTLTDKVGGIGVLSTAATSNNGMTIPLSPEEKDRLHSELKQNYGLSKGKRNVILSTAALNYTSLANPMKDWEFDKNTERDFMLGCNLFKIPKELLIKDATYENKKHALIDYYSGDPLSTMQSFGDAIINAFDYGGKLVPSYEHLPVMQEKKKERAEYLNTLFDAYSKAANLGADENIIKDLVEKELL